MNKEQIELLLKDLCGRLPYKVYAQIPDEYGDHWERHYDIDVIAWCLIENIEPFKF